MYKYDPEKLEMHIDPRGPNRWKWMVAEKSKGPLISGETTGSRSKAAAEAESAMDELIDKAGD